MVVPRLGEERYAQTLTGAVPATLAPARAPSTPAATPADAAPRTAAAPAPDPDIEGRAQTLAKRVEELEFTVTRLRRQLDNLAWRLGEKLEG